MRKVAYNNCFGGFGLSEKAKQLAYEKTGDKNWIEKYAYMENVRHNETLIEVIEELGEEANGMFADLSIVEVDGPYRIDEYDGNETVETPDSYEWS